MFVYKNLSSKIAVLLIITFVLSAYAVGISQNSGSSGGGMTGGSSYSIQTVNIGVWDMNASTTTTVSGVSGTGTNVRVVDIWVYNDAQSILYNLLTYQGTPQQISGSVSDVVDNGDGTYDITFDRLSSGFFDDVNFDDGVINRGFITVIEAN